MGRKHGSARARRHLPPRHGQRASAGQAPRRPAASGGDLVGRIRLHRDGYGFVTPRPPLPDVDGDVFIPPPAVGEAMDGDTVAVRLLRKAEGRAEGRVVAVVKRGHETVVGEFRAAIPHNYVQPYDDRLRDPILIPPGREIPPAGLERHRVLGDEARHTSPGAIRNATALDGLVVDVAIDHYPSATSALRGHVIEVLGRRDDFGVDVEIVIRKFHIPHRFPDAVLREAERLPSALPADELALRRDFRGLPVVTIDGETARDFDDAVHVVRRSDRRFELQVHIADVSWYVAPGSAIDREARLRGTSVYFPDRAVPMLPAELSTGLCSLRPGEDRLTMSCLMTFGADGALEQYEIVPGVIRSAARMTYTEVNAILSDDAAARSRHAPRVAMFELMAELQAVLYDRRMRRGAIDFDLPEPEIAFDEFGLMRAIVKSERNRAHRIIEEFMLAAAETVARHLRQAGVPSVYRIHEKPDLEKVAEFEETAAAFGHTLGVGPLPMRRVHGRDRGRPARPGAAGGPRLAPATHKFAVTPRHYQRLAARIAGTSEERILSYLMLRSLQQARYSADNVGHFALATDAYTHFTSPIRRYPDLMLHRILKSVLEIEPRLPAELQDEKALERLCADASETERRADDAERELMDWKKVRYMERRMGEEFPALVLHCTRQGLYLELVDMFIEGFIPAASLGEDHWQFREPERIWVGRRSGRRFAPGTRIQVIVERIDPVRHQVHFAPV